MNIAVLYSPDAMDQDNGYHSDSEIRDTDSSMQHSGESQDRLLHDLNYDGNLTFAIL